MKFIVTNEAFNTVEVKLHWESKGKIKRAVAWTVGVSCLVGVGFAYVYSRKET